MGRTGLRLLEEGREWKLPGLLCADYSLLYGESVEDLRGRVGPFVEGCRKKGLKVNANKTKVMVLNGEDGKVCEVFIDGCVLDESNKDVPEYRRKVVRGGKIPG